MVPLGRGQRGCLHAGADGGEEAGDEGLLARGGAAERGRNTLIAFDTVSFKGFKPGLKTSVQKFAHSKHSRSSRDH